MCVKKIFFYQFLVYCWLFSKVTETVSVFNQSSAKKYKMYMIYILHHLIRWSNKITNFMTISWFIIECSIFIKLQINKNCLLFIQSSIIKKKYNTCKSMSVDSAGGTPWSCSRRTPWWSARYSRTRRTLSTLTNSAFSFSYRARSRTPWSVTGTPWRSTTPVSSLSQVSYCPFVCSMQASLTFCVSVNC